MRKPRHCYQSGCKISRGLRRIVYTFLYWTEVGWLCKVHLAKWKKDLKRTGYGRVLEVSK